jgi:hypothetical protein
MSNTDWIDHRKFYRMRQYTVWRQTITKQANQTNFGWPADACAALDNAFQAAFQADDAYNGTPTPGLQHVKEDADKAAEKALRVFAEEYVRFNHKVTHDVLIELGIRPADSDTSPTAPAVPEDGPEPQLEIDANAPGRVRVRYPGARPAGSVDCEIIWCFAPAPPDRAEEFPDAQFGSFTHNPWERTFGTVPVGSRFHCALRWAMSGNRSSPWSVVRSCVVG